MRSTPIRATSCSRSARTQLFEFATADRQPARPAARARAAAHRPLRQLRLDPRLPAARPLQFRRPRADRRLPGRRATTAASRPTTRTSPKASWSGSTSSSAATAARRRDPPRASSRPRSTDLTRSFGDLIVAAAADPDAVDALSRGVLRRPTSRATPPEQRSPTSPSSSRSATAARLRCSCAAAAEMASSGFAFYHRGSADPAQRPRADARELRLPRHRRAHLHDHAAPTAAERYLHDMVLGGSPGARLDVGEPVAPRSRPRSSRCGPAPPRATRFNQLTLRGAARLVRRRPSCARSRRYLRQIGVSYSQTLSRERARRSIPTSRRRWSRCSTRSTTRASPATATAPPRSRREIIARGARRHPLDRRGPHRPALPQPGRRQPAHQRLPARRRRQPPPGAGDQVRLRARSTGCPSRGPIARSSSIRRASRACTCASAPIARGGIRWSDRPEDFRTEVLGLVKAQQVKNAVIVPVGAKGGVRAQAACRRARRARQSRPRASPATRSSSRRCSTSPTTSTATSSCRRPTCARRDGDDPYLVVAADKGTASFSDTANAIALTRGFWLGDAFASGGSVGYDHKKMGITARGAWEAVKRHFRELDRDIQTRAVHRRRRRRHVAATCSATACCCRQTTRLIAAFDHRDIFIDPDPDPAASHRRAAAAVRPAALELAGLRQDAAVARAAASIPAPRSRCRCRPRRGTRSGSAPATLTPERRDHAPSSRPTSICCASAASAPMSAPASETEAQAGDQANDAVRITGNEVRAKVVGEGANLGDDPARPHRVRAATAAGSTPTPSTTRRASIRPTSRSTSRSRSAASCAGGALDEKAAQRVPRDA